MKRIVFILAGGASHRMAGRDKATARLDGERLIDRVINRLQPQSDRLLISAAIDYDTGLACVPDMRGPIAGTPAGPAGAVFTLSDWVRKNEPETGGFYTAPVDGPFAPDDLVKRLGESGTSSVAADPTRIHPTFAFWTCAAVATARLKLIAASSVSLTGLAEACHARRVVWGDAGAMFNINNAADLNAAQKLIKDFPPGD